MVVVAIANAAVACDSLRYKYTARRTHRRALYPRLSQRSNPRTSNHVLRQRVSVSMHRVVCALPHCLLLPVRCSICDCDCAECRLPWGLLAYSLLLRALQSGVLFIALAYLLIVFLIHIFTPRKVHALVLSGGAHNRPFGRELTRFVWLCRLWRVCFCCFIPTFQSSKRYNQLNMITSLFISTLLLCSLAVGLVCVCVCVPESSNVWLVVTSPSALTTSRSGGSSDCIVSGERNRD